MPEPVLFIAAHGTRDGTGEDDARRFGERVQAALPDVSVHTAFIELSEPLLSEAVANIAAQVGSSLAPGQRGRVVTVPLMLAYGGHAEDDIPEAVEVGRYLNPDIDWHVTDVLGPDERLVEAMVSRIDEAGTAPAADTTVLLIGRGSSHVSSTANVAATARRVMHTGGYHAVETAFIAVARPSIEDGLDRVARLVDSPDTPVVVASYLLFRGLMINDITGRVTAWQAANPGRLTNLRVTTVLGDDTGLVDVVVSRYREGCAVLGAAAAPGPLPAASDGESDWVSSSSDVTAVPTIEPRDELPFVPYPVGLRLQGRRVVVIGGGKVARRRVEGLLAAEAEVIVVAPEAVPEIETHADAGHLRWERRRYRPSDTNDAWYVVACTDSPDVNAAVADAAEERGIFCVRADDGRHASAWTPAVGRVGDVTVAVLSNRQPYLSRAVRDEVVADLESGRIRRA